jgi:hypothetical protein
LFLSNKSEQEWACAQAFLNWLGSAQGVTYELERAKKVYGGRWDFVAQKRGSKEWLGIEIKSLVISEDNRQFNSWDSFLSKVSGRLPGRVRGSYLVMANMPWKFRQQEEKELVEPFIEALADLDRDLKEREVGNLGLRIAARFSKWPTDPPIIDQKTSLEQGKCEFTLPPKDLTVSKYSNEGSTIGSLSIPLPHNVYETQVQVVRDIFERDKRGQVKPNIQLTEAKNKGASSTVLLLDSQIDWRPTEVRWALYHCVDDSSMSSVDAVCLVDAGGGRVELVWNSKGWDS